MSTAHTATASPTRRTPFYEKHLALNARMAPFGGFDMPIQYTGIIQEHQACRTATAIFDTCHMGEFFMSGPQAAADLDRLVSCDVASMAIGQCRYGLLCNVEGGVRDDLIVYRLAADAFMIVVNAGTQDADFAWFLAHRSLDTELENRSDATAKLDIQGPGSAKIVNRLLADPIDALRFYRFMDNVCAGSKIIVSRTGYTGEIGFELYTNIDTAHRIWDDCLNAGVVPAGLGARDTLRLEIGMPLYGHELGEDRNAAESGFTSAIAVTKNFVGAPAVRDPARHRQALVGITLEGRRTARAGDSVRAANGALIGAVTSGSFAPTLGHAIALAYVDRTHATIGTAITIQTARDTLPGTLTKPPFYKSATARRPIAEFL